MTHRRAHFGTVRQDSFLESGYAFGQWATRQELRVADRAVKIDVYVLDRDIAPKKIRPDEFRERGAGLLIAPGIAHEPRERTVDIVDELIQPVRNADVMVPHPVLIQG